MVEEKFEVSGQKRHPRKTVCTKDTNKRYLTVFDKDKKVVASFEIEGWLDGSQIISDGYNFEDSDVEPHFFVPDDTKDMHVVTNKKVFGG